MLPTGDAEESHPTPGVQWAQGWRFLRLYPSNPVPARSWAIARGRSERSGLWFKMSTPKPFRRREGRGGRRADSRLRPCSPSPARTRTTPKGSCSPR